MALSSGISTYSQNKELKKIRARECETLFKTISKNATEMGMKVNENKTQLLCVSVAINSQVSSFIETENKIIESTSSMILFGFCFGNRPTVGPYVDFIKKKVNSRAWLIRHLKQAGVQQSDLATIFATTICPVIEYTAPVYHSLLTSTQSEELEKLQRRTLKIIYGHKTSYRPPLEMPASLHWKNEGKRFLKNSPAGGEKFHD